MAMMKTSKPRTQSSGGQAMMKKKSPLAGASTGATTSGMAMKKTKKPRTTGGSASKPATRTKLY